MRRFLLGCGFAAAVCSLPSCVSHYGVTKVEGSRILVDGRLDAMPDNDALAFLAPYKKAVDSITSPVVGATDGYMWAERPESNLSDLVADVLLDAGRRMDSHSDFAVYNMGAIRASLPSGTVRHGDVLSMAPFQNKVCVVSLTGDRVLELFSQIARNGGEAVSRGVELRINARGQLMSARLNGRDIDKNAVYRIATIDYVARGNDGLTAFLYKTDVVMPDDESNNILLYIEGYFRERAKAGLTVGAKAEGRIVVE